MAAGVRYALPFAARLCPAGVAGVAVVAGVLRLLGRSSLTRLGVGVILGGSTFAEPGGEGGTVVGLFPTPGFASTDLRSFFLADQLQLHTTRFQYSSMGKK